MFPQFKDVVTHYKPSIIFSDGEWELTSDDWRSPELLAWLFNESPVNDEVVDRRPLGQGHAPQARRLLHHRVHLRHAAAWRIPWEESRGMGYSYGYNRMETLERLPHRRELLMMLIDIVSRGGNLLLDIGPTADGRIPGDHGGAPARDRRVAAAQRRGDLRHAAVEEDAAVERGRDAEGEVQQEFNRPTT